MRTSGYIQEVFIPSKAPQLDKKDMRIKTVAIATERNAVRVFRNLWQLVVGVLAASRSGCDKAYIFFDKPKLKSETETK